MNTLARLALLSCLLVSASSAWAVQLSDDPAMVASMTENTLNPKSSSGKVRKVSSPVPGEDRAVQEFDVRPLKGLTILSATLEGQVGASDSQNVGVRHFDFHLYQGNGLMEVPDYWISADLVGEASYTPPAQTSFNYSFDVTAALQAVVDGGATHAGLRVACTAVCATNFLVAGLTSKLTVTASDPVCGNGNIEVAEQCDDENGTPGDGCNASCELETTCGDGIVGAGEQCDDANQTAWDGCEPDCMFTQISVGKIYTSVWRGDAEGGKILRFDPSGTNVEVVLEGPLARARAFQVDHEQGKLYWIGVNGLLRANLDGSNVELVLNITGSSFEIDFAAGKVYWVPFVPDEILCRSLDGTGFQVLLAGLTDPVGIALDKRAGKLYWTEDNLIRRANLDGSGIQTIAQISLFLVGDIEIDPALSKIWWIDGGLYRAELDGTNAQVLDGVATGNFALAPGATVYWVGPPDFTPSPLFKMDVDGTSKQQVFAYEEFGHLEGVALVDQSLIPDPTPPAVPDDLRVLKAPGGGLRIQFDTESCVGDLSHHLIYGFGSALPGAPGGAFLVDGAACSITGSPFNWTGVPDPTVDPSGLLWFLMLANDGASTEGSWGTDSAGDERVGPGTGGASAGCGMMAKDLQNSCGQ